MGSYRDLLPDSDEPPDPDPSTPGGLLELLDAQASFLITVATGGNRIDDVNGRNICRRRKLDSALRRRGITPPFPYDDLWAWHGYWTANLGDGTAGGYAARRAHIRRLATPVRAQLEAILDGVQVSDPGGSTVPTWAALDARVEGISNELRDARSKDDLQDVGRRCREVLIDVARLLADPALVPAGQEAPKDGDAKGWLELFVAAEAGGRSHRELRAFIPTAWDLAQKVTHGDTGRVDAYAAAQATILIVRTLQQLAAGSQAE